MASRTLFSMENGDPDIKTPGGFVAILYTGNRRSCPFMFREKPEESAGTGRVKKYSKVVVKKKNTGMLYFLENGA